MRFILKFFIVLLFLGIGIVITGLFLPQKFKSVKKLQIAASQIIVFEQINNLKKWPNWHPWYAMDSLLTTQYLQSWEGKGSEMMIESPVIGNCTVSLTHSVFPESIAVHYNFNLESTMIALIYLEPSEEGTRINFTLNIKGLALWERFFLLFNKKKIDNMVAESVIGLKNVSEGLKYSRIGDITIEKHESKPAVIKVDSVNKNLIHSQIASGFDYLNRFFERRGITPLDLPFTLRYGLLNDTLEKVGVGRIIPERTWIWKTLQQYEVPGGKAVVVSYFGGRNTEKAHKAIQKYIEDEELKITGVPREVAMYNTSTDTDSSLWETKVYYPVE